MNLLAAAAVAALFAGGLALALSRSVLRVVAGVLTFSQAAILFVVAAARPGEAAPIAPATSPASDPVLQALALTALVIGFGLTAFLLALAYRTHAEHGSLDLRRIVPGERDEADGEGAPGEERDA